MYIYGWCNETAPVDYGLVVIDLQNKKIHSMQGYDTPGTLYGISFSESWVYEKEIIEDYKQIISNNLLDVYDRELNKLGDITSIFGENTTLEKIQELIKESYNPINSVKNFVREKILGEHKVDLLSLVFVPKKLSEFEMIVYKENPEDLVCFAKNLIKEGFILNTEELKIWKESIKDFDDEEFFNSNELENITDKEFESQSAIRRENCINRFDEITKINKPKIKP